MRTYIPVEYGVPAAAAFLYANVNDHVLDFRSLTSSLTTALSSSPPTDTVAAAATSPM